MNRQMNYDKLYEALQDAQESVENILMLRSQYAHEPNIKEFYEPSADYLANIWLKHLYEQLDRVFTYKDMYRHYKGGIYQVLHIGYYEEDREKTAVIYRSQDTGQVWIRPYQNFFEHVFHEDEWVPRFKRIDDENSPI